ncbi:cation transporter [Methylobacterium platani]|uniref:Cobalt transporter n=2 Tax=Methylobacterium platani TaxID=427683 RepID=A0A179S4V2_9HYPH|nr:cation transporter [Methylobacterium platani]KMO10489.1 cobalt transporter [Methylobacterium platani JCM 14648]OAS19358.1 cobalt transporter [Methylobacterium platani]
MISSDTDPGLRATVGRVALLNLGYFGIEAAVAVAIGSVALVADSVDFLEDAALNLLIVAGLGWRPAARARLGTVMAGILLLPGLAALWTAWHKLGAFAAPAPVPLTLTGLGALAVNLACALMLARHREGQGSLTRAAFLSARNDAVANVAIVAAGLVTAATLSTWPAFAPWPDLVVGLGIAAMNADAAREIWQAAAAERRAAREAA